MKAASTDEAEVWEDGYEAGECGAGQLDNPHGKGSVMHSMWEEGRKLGDQVARTRIDSYSSVEICLERISVILIAAIAAILLVIYGL